MGGLFQNVGRGQLMFEVRNWFLFFIGPRWTRVVCIYVLTCLVGKVPGGGVMLDMADGAKQAKPSLHNTHRLRIHTIPGEKYVGEGMRM